MMFGTLGVFALLSSIQPVQGAPATDRDAEPTAPRIEWFDAPRAVDARRPATLRAASTTFQTLNQDPEGDMPRDATFTPDGTRVLVVNRDTDTVTVFDFATQTILETISVGDFPVDVEIAPDGSVAAVPNVLDDTVSLIDMATLTVVATVPVTQSTGEGQPYRVAFDAASTTCVVGVIDGATDSSFSLIDLATRTEIASIPTSPQGATGFFATPEPGIFGNLFTDFAISADASFALLPDRGADLLNAYSLTTGALLASLPIGDAPAYVDLSADGLAAVVSLAGATDSVVSLSVAAGVPTVVNTTPTNLSAFDPQVRITPDKAYAIVAVQNAVEFIDLAAGQVVSTVSTGSVGDIEFTFDDQYAVVTNFNTRVIRLSTRTQVAQLSLAATADAAISPVSHALVGLNNRFAEDLHFYSTDGFSSQVLGRALSGEEPEVDAPRRVTITPDGRTALIVGNTSRSMASFDIPSRTVTNIYPIGSRGWEVATDAAGTVAVVTSTESDQIDVIDLAVGQVVATLSAGVRPTEVAVSPDGTRAYVTTVASTDRVYFIDLAGAASTITSSLPIGQLGSIGYNGGTSSGIALSPDGATLAVCVSFEDTLKLLDTASGTLVATVPVGDFPLGCAWSPAGDSVYVSNTFGDSITKVAFTGPTSSAVGTATGQDGANLLSVDATGDYLYAGNFTTTGPPLSVIDTATMAQVSSVALTSRSVAMQLVADTLFVTSDSAVQRIRAAGPQAALLESIDISATPTDLAFSAAFGTAITTQPGAQDGIDLTVFGGTPTNECGPAVPNSTGLPGRMEASGTFLAGGFPLTIRAVDLPQNSFGYFLHSSTTGFVNQPGGSQGNLCLGGTIGRFNAQAMSSGQTGTIEIQVDTQNLPSVPTSTSILPGDTWSFQAWHRDANPTLTSNFTDRVTVTFE